MERIEFHYCFSNGQLFRVRARKRNGGIMIKVGLLLSFIGLMLAGFASKKAGGFSRYLETNVRHGGRRGSGWFLQIFNLGLLITILGIIIKLLT